MTEKELEESLELTDAQKRAMHESITALHQIWNHQYGQIFAVQTAMRALLTMNPEAREVVATALQEMQLLVDANEPSDANRAGFQQMHQTLLTALKPDTLPN